MVTGVGWGGLVAVPHREQPWGSLCSGLGAPALLASLEGAKGGRGGRVEPGLFAGVLCHTRGTPEPLSVSQPAHGCSP